MLTIKTTRQNKKQVVVVAAAATLVTSFGALDLLSYSTVWVIKDQRVVPAHDESSAGSRRYNKDHFPTKLLSLELSTIVRTSSFGLYLVFMRSSAAICIHRACLSYATVLSPMLNSGGQRNKKNPSPVH